MSLLEGTPGTRRPEALPDPAPARPSPLPLRRRPGGVSATDAATVVGCALSAVFVDVVVLHLLGSSPGLLADAALTYATFLVLVFVTAAEKLGRLGAVDRLMSVVVGSFVLALVVPLGSLIVYVCARGLPHLRPSFFVHDLRGVLPSDPATAGGGLHAIIGTLEQAGMALVAVVPLGVLTAVFLNETESRLRQPVRTVVEAMSGLPSIVAGLFIYSVLVAGQLGLRLGFSGFAAALALSLTMLPTMTRTVEVVLRLVPDSLREASLALGASRARTVWSVVLPTARSGVTTAVVLGLARIVGETAPLLFTAFGQTLLNADPTHGAQESLPLFVWRFVKSASPSETDRGYTGACVLILVVLTLFVTARWIGRPRKLSRRRHRTARRRTTSRTPSTGGPR